jgi:succinoglycan biosynthesis transport protein ExoP
VAGTATLQECVHQIAGSKLMVIPAGDVPPNPLEMLLSQRFKDVLNHLQPQLDFIIVDSPPVELVSDALTLAALVHETIFVVRADESAIPTARKSLGRLQRAGAHIQGIVVNGLDFDKAQRYYGETSYGSYNGTKGYAAYGSYGVKTPDDAPQTIQAHTTI